MATVTVYRRAGDDGVLRLEVPVGMPGVLFEIVFKPEGEPERPPIPPVIAPATGEGPLIDDDSFFEAMKSVRKQRANWPPGFVENVVGSIDDEAFM